MWRDPAWILDMLQAARKALEYAQNLTEGQYLGSSRDQDAIIRQLTIVGEAAKRVSPEFKAEHSEIPWRKIAGFRDVVVHDYFHVDIKEVWRIVRGELPTLAKMLEPLLPPKEE
jgi:uncharacterized protein with HEPN domain